MVVVCSPKNTPLAKAPAKLDYSGWRSFFLAFNTVAGRSRNRGDAGETTGESVVAEAHQEKTSSEPIDVVDLVPKTREFLPILKSGLRFSTKQTLMYIKLDQKCYFYLKKAHFTMNDIRHNDQNYCYC
jgi:hypothetical protein